MLHRAILTAASVLALTTVANAADMYRPAPSYKDTPYVGVNWSGLYVGINGGAAQNDAAGSDSVGFFGGQVGYNIQRGSLVFGLETDLQGIDASDADYFGTVRGRLGFAFDRALVYGTGGFAYLGSDCSGCTTDDGWAAGGGIEYKVTPNWSVKGEYQHLEFTSVTPNYGVDTFRIGVNFFVGGGYDGLK